jgi:hypothetical protein
MTDLAVWLVLASIISFTFRHRPLITVSLALAIWVLLPALAAHRVVGFSTGVFATHPATWLVLAQVGVCLLSDPVRLARAGSRHVFLSVVVSVFIVGAAATSILTGYGGWRLLMDQIVGPVAAFWLVMAYGLTDETAGRLLRGTFVSLAVFESMLALVQSRLDSVLVFENDFRRVYWFNPERFERWMGTTDSPLVLALLVCIAAPLAAGIRIVPLRFGALLIMTLGVITTQSRTGVTVMAFIVVYLVVRSKMVLVVRLASVFLVLASANSILRSDFVSGISSRLSSDTGSTAARGRALDFFLSRLGSLSWSGNGLTSSYRIASEGGLITSLESSFLMYAIDVGLPLAVLYFGAQILVILWHSPANRIQGAALGALFGALMQHSFSGLGFSNLSGFAVWCAIALVVTGSSRIEIASDDSYAPVRRSNATSARV